MSEQTKELQRALRLNLEELMAQITPEQSKQMEVSLAHAMSRFKLKFSPDKVDIMIIQAIGLLDDLGTYYTCFVLCENKCCNCKCNHIHYHSEDAVSPIRFHEFSITSSASPIRNPPNDHHVQTRT